MKICTTEQEFINAVAPYAQKVCKRFGFYLPSVLIAQAAKENGYGIRSYWDNPGVEALVAYNNMVGIKRELLNKSWVDVGLSVWPGKWINKKTPEVYGGIPVTIYDDFRIYDNIEQSFADYLCFMRWGGYSVGNPKYYDKIKNLKDYKSLIKQVHSLGYATGTTYSSGIIKIIEKHNLTKYDDLTNVQPSTIYPTAAQKKEGENVANSSLVNYTKLSPNNSGKRTAKIDRITPHCVVGQLSVETMGAMFAKSSYQASCNYAIGSDGRVALIVDESKRSWCSSSSANDQRAVTIECASEKTHPYAINSSVYNKLIDLCVDICRRNGKTVLLWLGDKNKTLNYQPKANEMVITVHRWFANKACPGDFIYSRLGIIAAEVTKRLGGKVEEIKYKVRLTWNDEKSQKGAFVYYDKAVECADKNPGYTVFTLDGKAKYTSQNTQNTTQNQSNTSAPSTNQNNKSDGKQTAKTVFYRVQVGVFSTTSKRDSLIKDIKKKLNFDCFYEKTGNNYYVYCGSYKEKATAEQRMAQIKAKGFSAFIKTVS